MGKSEPLPGLKLAQLYELVFSFRRQEKLHS